MWVSVRNLFCIFFPFPNFFFIYFSSLEEVEFWSRICLYRDCRKQFSYITDYRRKLLSRKLLLLWWNIIGFFYNRHDKLTFRSTIPQHCSSILYARLHIIFQWDYVTYQGCNKSFLYETTFLFSFLKIAM